MLRDLNERIRLLRIHDFTDEQRIRATIDEHLEILGALLVRDPDSAREFLILPPRIDAGSGAGTAGLVGGL